MKRRKSLVKMVFKLLTVSLGMLVVCTALSGCSIAECQQDSDCSASQTCSEGKCSVSQQPKEKAGSPQPKDTTGKQTPVGQDPTPKKKLIPDDVLKKPDDSSDLPPAPEDVPAEGLAEFHPCTQHTKCKEGLYCIAASAKVSHGICLKMVNDCTPNACGDGRICMKLQGGGGTCFKHCQSHDACPHSQHCTPIQNHGELDLVCLPG